MERYFCFDCESSVTLGRARLPSDSKGTRCPLCESRRIMEWKVGEPVPGYRGLAPEDPYFDGVADGFCEGLAHDALARLIGQGG